MFNKETQEQTEPGSALLEYLGAQILNILPLGGNHSGASCV